MAECTVCYLPSAPWGWFMVLIDESTRDGLLCWVAATAAPSRSSNGLRFYSGIRGKVTNTTFDLCCRTTGDLTSTLAGIQMQQRLCSDSQPAAASLLERKVCEISARPPAPGSLHQIKEYYRNWMSTEAWFFLFNTNASIEQPPHHLLELLCPRVQ